MMTSYLSTKKKEVVECLYSNVSWIKDNKWFSPSLKTGCIGGIMLEQIEKELNKKNIQIAYGNYSIEALLNADVVINSNITGINYLSKVENTSFLSSHPHIITLQKKFA